VLAVAVVLLAAAAVLLRLLPLTTLTPSCWK
jgi:hypothetical protein